MRKLRLIVISGLIAMAVTAAPAAACGFHPGFPYQPGCLCFGFVGVGTHLGLGPGYPGFYPPVYHALPFLGFPQTPRVTVHILRAPGYGAGAEPQRPGRIAEAGVSSPGRRSAAGAKDAQDSSGSAAYAARRYHRGRYYPVREGSGEPGIIVWSPEE